MHTTRKKEEGKMMKKATRINHNCNTFYSSLF